MRFLTVALAALWLVPCAEAETVHKCFDANGRVTYQSQSCTRTHLKEGGQIEPAAEVAPEDVERVRAATEKTRARLEEHQKAKTEVSFPRFLVFQEVGFMLPVFPHAEH